MEIPKLPIQKIAPRAYLYPANASPMEKLLWIYQNYKPGTYLLGTVVREGKDKNGRDYHIAQLLDSDQKVFCPDNVWSKFSVDGKKIVAYSTNLKEPRNGQYPVAKQLSNGLMPIESLFEEGTDSIFWSSIGGEHWTLIKASDLAQYPFNEMYRFQPGNLPGFRDWLVDDEKAIRGYLVPVKSYYQVVDPDDPWGDDYDDPWTLSPKGPDW